MSKSVAGPADSARSSPLIVIEHRPWFIALGVALIVLGILAVMFPLVTAVAAKLFLGWVFLIGGIVHVVHAYSTRTWGAVALDVLEGALFVLAGAWLVFFPLAGVVTLTLFVACLFIAQGVVEGAMALRVRPAKGWFWMLVAGFVAVLAGVMIISGLPGTAAWVIGFLVGVKLMPSGWAYLFLALNARE